MMAFDLDNLKVFLAAVDHGSFSAAARSLRRVPSAVSMAIANLEAELGLQLFDRGGREPRPTQHADALVPQARMLLGQLQKLNNHAASLNQGLESSLRIALVPELLAAAPWGEALRLLVNDYPLLKIEVLTAPQADALKLLQSGRADLALVYERYGIDADEAFEEVAEERMVAVVSPSHPMCERMRQGQIRDDDLLSERQVIVAGRDTEHVDKRIAISRQQWRTDNPVAALTLVKAGLAWAWLPSGFVCELIERGDLVAIPTANFTNVLRFFVDVIWTTERPLGLAARRFIALMNALRRDEKNARQSGGQA